jgi:hypothetical protein
MKGRWFHVCGELKQRMGFVNIRGAAFFAGRLFAEFFITAPLVARAGGLHARREMSNFSLTMIEGSLLRLRLNSNTASLAR